MSILSMFKTQEARDLAENEELVAKYRTFPERYQEAFPRRDEAHKECLKIARQLNDQKTAKAPQNIILDLEKKLERAIWARDGEIRSLGLEREEIGRQIENSGSSDEVQNAVREFQGALKDSHRLIKVDYQKSVHDPFTGKRTTTYASNHATVAEVRELLLSAVQKLLNMRRNRITEIRTFVEETKTKLVEIDINKMEPDEIPAGRATELKPETDSGEMDKATVMPDGSIHIHPKPPDPRVKGLADRVSNLEKNP